MGVLNCSHLEPLQLETLLNESTELELCITFTVKDLTEKEC